MRRFLESDGHARWYYVTFGLGDSEFQRLSRMTSARTIDGYYASARIRRELRASAVGSLDASLHFPGGLAAAERALAAPASFNLRWAFVADPRYDPLLERAGWRRLYPLGSDARWTPGDPVHSTIVIWTASGAIPPAPADTVPPVPPLFPLLWGIAPAASLAGGVAAYLGSGAAS